MQATVNGVTIELTADQIRHIEEQLKPKPTFEEVFIGMLDGCMLNFDKEHPDSVFLMKDGKLWFEIEKSYFWCKYDTVWAVLSNQFSLSYSEIQSRIKTVVEERFKMKGLTP